MREGYHRLSATLIEDRDEKIIRLVQDGLRHKVIAHRVGLKLAGLQARLQKLREEGKLLSRRRGDEGSEKETG